MLKSYEAIYDHGHIQWLGAPPSFKRVRVVLVADDAHELDELSESTHPTKNPNGMQLVDIVRSTSPDILKSIAEKYGDPVIWQREQRKDRALPGREND